MKKMPPPEKMPPNGNSSSPHNGRAEEPSAGERITRLEVLVQNCATKTDLEMLRGEMKTEMAALNGRMDSLSNELKAEMADFRAEMTDKMNTMLRWIIGSMGTMIIAVLSLLAAFLFRLF